MLFLAAIVSGVVLYAPFMARLRFGTVRRTGNGRVTRLDRHNLLGIVTLAWAVVVGLTGTINTLVVPITDRWKAGQLALIAAPGPVPSLAGRASVSGGGRYRDARRAGDAAAIHCLSGRRLIAATGITASSCKARRH